MILESNFEALKRKKIFEPLFNEDGGLKEYSTSDVEIVSSKMGEPIVQYKKDGKDYYLNSRYNVQYETIKFWGEDFDSPPKSIVTMFGFSNGSYVRTLLDNNSDIAMCLVYEPSMNIFMKVLEEIDISDLLNNPRLAIAVKGINENIFSTGLMHYIDKLNIKTNKYVVIPKYRGLFQEEFTEYQNIVRDGIKSESVNIQTLSLLGKHICKTTIENMRFLKGSRNGLEYKDKFDPDFPAVIVSAGPSLKNNIELLKSIRNKAIIVVVDTAVSASTKYGIVPDVIISVDNHKVIKNIYFDGIEKIPFMVDMAVNTNLLEQIQSENLSFYSSDSMVWDKLYKSVGSEIQNIYSGGSVTIDAISLMIAWGLKKLILIGLDLAFTGDQRYTGEGLEKDPNQGAKVIMIKDIYGEDLATRQDYYDYIKFIENMAYEFSDVEFIDATEGGAYKKNVTITTLQYAIDKYCVKECDVQEVLESGRRLFVGDDEKLVLESLQTMVENINNIAQEMQGGVEMCDEALDLLDKQSIDFSRLRVINQQIADLENQYEAMDEHSIISRYISHETLDFVTTIYTGGDDDLEETRRLYRNSKNIYENIIKAAPELIEIINGAIEKL